MVRYFLVRTTLVAAAALALTTTSVGGALADQPDAASLEGDGAKYSEPDSNFDSAAQAKLAMAAAYEAYAAAGVWDARALTSQGYPVSAPLSS